MQVISHQASAGITTARAAMKGIDIGRPQRVTSPKPLAITETFPESGFLSIKPLRYNVQLNHQLTSLQQAEQYLLKTEHQLSQLQKGMNQNDAAIKQSADKLLSWLEQREVVSQGTVDRQLKISLAENAKVNFKAEGLSQLLDSNENETLLFALADSASSVVAVKLNGQHSPQQKLRQLNNALGRLGIHGKWDNHQAVFQTDEHQWARINTHLSVRGGGVNYPADQFQKVELQPERALENTISEIANQPAVIRQQNPLLQQTLSQITDQLRQLNKFKDNARERVAGMVSEIPPNSAVMVAERLVEKQFSGRSAYAVSAQIVHGQGQLHNNRVRNLFINEPVSASRF